MNKFTKVNNIVKYNINGKDIIDKYNNETEQELNENLFRMNETINYDISNAFIINDNKKKDKNVAKKALVKRAIISYFLKLEKMAKEANEPLNKITIGIVNDSHSGNWFIYNGGKGKDIEIDDIKIKPWCARADYDNGKVIVNCIIEKDDKTEQYTFNTSEEVKMLDKIINNIEVQKEMQEFKKVA